MTSRVSILCTILLLATSLLADQVKLGTLTVGATTYRDVTVLGANTTDLYFTHSGGIANVKLKHLSPDLQKMFNYDPKASAEAEQKQAENDSLYQQKLASQVASAAPGGSSASKDNTPSAEASLADPVSSQSLLGRHAPPLEVEKWLGQPPVLKGKCALITFWAPWSVPCRKSIPDLNALQKKFPDKLIVIGLTSESEATLAGYSEPALEFLSAIDTKARLRTAAGITSVPCVLLLDPDGIVRYQGHPAALTDKKLQALMGKALE